MFINGGATAVSGRETGLLFDAVLEYHQEDNAADHQRSDNRDSDYVAALTAPVLFLRVKRRSGHGFSFFATAAIATGHVAVMRF